MENSPCGKFMHLIQIAKLKNGSVHCPVHLHTGAAPSVYTVHCFSFNALPGEIRTRNHGISRPAHYPLHHSVGKIFHLLLSWGKFCTCSIKSYIFKQSKGNNGVSHNFETGFILFYGCHPSGGQPGEAKGLKQLALAILL